MVKLLIRMINPMFPQLWTSIGSSNVRRQFMMIKMKFRRIMQLILVYSRLVWIKLIKMKLKE